LTQQYLGHVSPSDANIDFYVYYFAAQGVHDNPYADLYAGAIDGNPQSLSAPTGSTIFTHAKAAGIDDVQLYLYPPLLADLLAPFSRIPVHLAVTLWRAFNIALVFASVLMLARIVRISILGFEFAVLALAAYSFFPVHEAIWIGQATIIMLALWTVGIAAYCEDRVILSAAAFALATAFKVTPILLLPLFIIWKDRRWIISYFAVSLGLVSAMTVMNGLQNVSGSIEVISAMGSGIPSMANKTIGSLVAWIYYGKPFTPDTVLGVISSQPCGLIFVAKAISGVFYLICLFLVWRGRRAGRATRATTIAVFSLVTLCASPVSWRHGYSIAFIVLAIFWARALRTPTRVIHRVLLTVTTIVVGTVFLDAAAKTPAPQVCKILLSASWIVFSVLFCLVTLYHVNTDGTEEQNGISPCKRQPSSVD